MFSFSPRLIAAYHVFLRLPTPRHPPDALVYLFSKKTSFHPYAIVKELTFSGPPSSLLGSHSCNRTVTRLLPNKAWLESIFRMREPEWWAWKDLNFRPHAYQACALTT